MSQVVNQAPNSSLKKEPNSPDEKEKNKLSSKARRQRNLKLKGEAKDRATEAGLPWDDSIPAAQFFDNPKQAFKNATTPVEAKPVETPPADPVVEETRNGEPPTETVEVKPVAEVVEAKTEKKPNEQGKKKTKAQREAEKVAKKTERQAAQKAAEKARKAAEKAAETGKPLEDEVVTGEPKGEATLPGVTAPLTAAQETVRAAKAAILGTSAGSAVVYDSTNQPEVDPVLPSEAETSTAAETIQDNAAPIEAEQPVCDDLVRESEEADAAQKAKNDAKKASVAEPALEAPSEESGQQDEAQPETPAEEAEPAQPAEVEQPAESSPASNEPVVETKLTEAELPKEEVNEGEKPSETETTLETPAAPEAPPVETNTETKKPPLKLVDTIAGEKKQYIEPARKFYGPAFTDERSVYLVEAYRFLAMAIRTEASAGGQPSKMSKMAFKNALQEEDKAFNIAKLAMAA